MTSPSEVLASIAEQQPDVYKLGKTFGNPCLKLVSTNKVPVMAREASIVLKLPQETINMLLKEEGNRMYIPMTGKPMKEWLEVPDTYAHRWEALIGEATAFIQTS